MWLPGLAATRRDPSWARRSVQRLLQVTIFAKCPFAITGDFVTFFAEKGDHGNAIAAIDLQFALNVGVGVAIQVSHFDRGRGLGEALEDRALARTIAAPRTGQAENVGFSF